MIPTEKERADAARARGNLTGSVFIVPVCLALILLMLWSLICVLLTPGAGAEGRYGELQGTLRVILVVAGVVFDGVGLGVLLWRLVVPTDAV
jgi:hypothetical protein